MKLIAIDIDGTLVNSKKEISPATKDILIQAQEAGHRVVLASGRPTRGMRQYVTPLKLDEFASYILSFNGARIHELATGDQIYAESLSPDLAQRILTHLKNFEVSPFIYGEEYIYVEDVYGAVINYQGKPLSLIEYESRLCDYLLCEKADLASFVDYPMPKILVAGEPEVLQATYQDMAAPFVDECTTSFSADFYFEFTRKNIDKGQSLKHLAQKLGIDMADVIAFGDSGNDKTMLELAGTGVAMANASQEVLEVADVVTGSNDEDGIVQYLEANL